MAQHSRHFPVRPKINTDHIKPACIDDILPNTQDIDNIVVERYCEAGRDMLKNFKGGNHEKSYQRLLRRLARILQDHNLIYDLCDFSNASKIAGSGAKYDFCALYQMGRDHINANTHVMEQRYPPSALMFIYEVKVKSEKAISLQILERIHFIHQLQHERQSMFFVDFLRCNVRKNGVTVRFTKALYLRDHQYVVFQTTRLPLTFENDDLRH